MSCRKNLNGRGEAAKAGFVLFPVCAPGVKRWAHCHFLKALLNSFKVKPVHSDSSWLTEIQSDRREIWLVSTMWQCQSSEHIRLSVWWTPTFYKAKQSKTTTQPNTWDFCWIMLSSERRNTAVHYLSTWGIMNILPCWWCLVWHAVKSCIITSLKHVYFSKQPVIMINTMIIEMTFSG